jgi:hypothetical protein
MNLFLMVTGLIKKHSKLVVVLVFAAIFGIGIIVAPDYGVPWDDPIQKQHSHIAAKAYLKALGIKMNDPGQDINEYYYKYYGTAIQMPVAFIELLFHKTITSRESFLLRHYWVFFVHFAGLIVFYFLLKMLFKRRFLGLLGVLMVFLYPRVFSNSFYNIKDMVFSSLFTIALYLSLLFLQNGRRLKFAALAGFFVALAVNSRFYALVILAGAAFFMLLEDVLIYLEAKNILGGVLPSQKERRRNIASYFVYFIVFYISLILITPASWSDPVKFIDKYLRHFYGYDEWNGPMFYWGKLIYKTETRFYFLSWLFISLPLCYMFLSALGSALLVKRTLVKQNFLQTVYNARYMFFIAALFYMPLLATILRPGLIYDGWRHLYFLLPYIVILALYGINAFWEKWRGKIRYAPLVLIISSLFLQALWIIRNHPHEADYFNTIGRRFAVGFDCALWGTSVYPLLLQLIKEIPDDKTIHLWSNSHPFNLLIMDEKTKNRVVYEDINDAEYAIVASMALTGAGYYGNDSKKMMVNGKYILDDFDEIRSIQVDGFKILSLLKRVRNFKTADDYSR